MLNSHICTFKKQVEISTSKLRAFEDQGPSKKKNWKLQMPGFIGGLQASHCWATNFFNTLNDGGQLTGRPLPLLWQDAT